MRRSTRKSSGSVEPAPSNAKRQRSTAGGTAPLAEEPAPAPRLQQRGIQHALAAQAARPTTELVLEQERRRGKLGHQLTQQLTTESEKYLQAWADKCYGMHSQAAGGSKGGSLRTQRAAAAASMSGQEMELDAAALPFLDLFQHLQRQAFKHGAAFDSQHLELLALILRCDVLHAVGDVSLQAYRLLHGYLQRFPYASLGRHEGGEFGGRPYVVLDELAAWQPLAALTSARGLTKRYLFEEAIKDGGHNYRVDASGMGATAASASRKKGGLLGSPLALIHLCLERAVDSVEEDYNGDVLLLRYLLALLHQDLSVRLEVFAAYADVADEAVQRRRSAVLANSLLWRIWTDAAETDDMRQRVVEKMVTLIVGVATEQDLQDVDEEHHRMDKEAEAAAPCICTPRELAGMAALTLNMLLDLFGAAEAAGRFVSTSTLRMDRQNWRLKLDQMIKERFWKWPHAKCKGEVASRTLLAALAPAHRLRLLSLLAMEQVAQAYYERESDSPAVVRAQRLVPEAKAAVAGEWPGAFPADPLVAVRCLNHDKTRSIRVFTNVGTGRAITNLAVLGSGIALAAHAMVAEGQELPVDCDASGGECGSSSTAAAGRQQLREALREFLAFVARKHKEALEAGRTSELSRASLCDLMHAQAAAALL